MRMLKMQLNTPPTITKDMVVTLTNQVSGEQRTVKPYLDGSIAVTNLVAGQWRVQAKHPNMVFDVFDRNVQVFSDRPTFAPINIPTNIFENVPIRETPEADLGPVQQRLDELTGTAQSQTNKLGGQPIYADDWNNLANTVGEVSRSTRELTDLVSAVGHDHPEIVEKIEEIQGNIQRFFDAFGAAIAQLQRQMQQLALQRKVETALEKVPNATPEVRKEMEDNAKELASAWLETPGIYSARKRRTAQKIQTQLVGLLAEADPEVRDNPDVKDLNDYAAAMATEPAVVTYEQEVAQQQRANKKSTRGIVSDAMQAGKVGGL
jgi:hypothetical protein